MMKSRFSKFQVYFLRRPSGATGSSLGSCLLENNILLPNEYYVYIRRNQIFEGYGKRTIFAYLEKIEEALREFNKIGIEFDKVAYQTELTDAIIFKIKDEANLRLLQLFQTVHIKGRDSNINRDTKFYVLHSDNYLNQYPHCQKEIAKWIDREPVQRRKDMETLNEKI